jgi:hypothetical protein
VFSEGHFASADPADAAGPMDAAVRTVAEVMFAEEAVFRNIVRATVDRWFAEQERPGPGPDPEAIRQTRRFEWIDRALAPLRGTLPPGQFRRLRYALALVFGAEALIVTRDVYRLPPTRPPTSCAGPPPPSSAPRPGREVTKLGPSAWFDFRERMPLGSLRAVSRRCLTCGRGGR